MSFLFTHSAFTIFPCIGFWVLYNSMTFFRVAIDKKKFFSVKVRNHVYTVPYDFINVLQFFAAAFIAFNEYAFCCTQDHCKRRFNVVFKTKKKPSSSLFPYHV